MQKPGHRAKVKRSEDGEVSQESEKTEGGQTEALKYSCRKRKQKGCRVIADITMVRSSLVNFDSHLHKVKLWFSLNHTAGAVFSTRYKI